MASWAKKELAKLKFFKSPRRLLLTPPKTSSPNFQEIVIAADLGCRRCHQRVAEAISRNIDDIESMVVHFVENKVALITPKTSPTKIAALNNNLIV